MNTLLLIIAILTSGSLGLLLGAILAGGKRAELETQIRILTATIQKLIDDNYTHGHLPCDTIAAARETIDILQNP